MELNRSVAVRGCCFGGFNGGETVWPNIPALVLGAGVRIFDWCGK